MLKILHHGESPVAGERGGGRRPKRTSQQQRFLPETKKRTKYKMIFGSGLGKVNGSGGDADDDGYPEKKKKKKKEKKNEQKDDDGGNSGGFLYSTQGPAAAAVRTIVIPRANKTLLRNLSLALAELRAGNEGEREECVQLAREAKKHGILPPFLLSEEEMKWSSSR